MRQLHWGHQVRCGPSVRALVLMAGMATVATAKDAQPARRNAIIFVADGLRHGSVNPTDTPALYRIRTEGVYFWRSTSRAS